MNRTAFIHTFTAIFLWSTLALLGHKLNQLPPFFLVGTALVIGGSISLPFYSQWSKRWQVILICVGGIFGYHFLLFSSFRLIPTLTANLLNYLWPLLMVILSPIMLTNYKLRRQHLLGISMGVGGTALLFFPLLTIALGTTSEQVIGGVLAVLAALIWALYSLQVKRIPIFNTATVGLCCLISGILSLALHLFIEPMPPLHKTDSFYLLMLGIGPMGIAFYSWDRALKNGDPRVIGSLAYCTPLLSTLLLCMGSNQDLTFLHLLALILIVGGAFVSNMNVAPWRLLVKKH